MAESQRIAEEGGEVASEARETKERRLGRSVVSSERASDYIRPIEDKGQNALPKEEEQFYEHHHHWSHIGHR